MADWHGIRSAIAAKCGAVSGVAAASADAIDAAPETPAVLITHIQDLNVVHRGAGFEYAEAEISGLLLVARTADTGSAMAEADDLIEGIRVAMRDGIHLGYPTTVQDSALLSAQADTITVADIEYVGYRLRFVASVREPVTRSA